MSSFLHRIFTKWRRHRWVGGVEITDLDGVTFSMGKCEKCDRHFQEIGKLPNRGCPGPTKERP